MHTLQKRAIWADFVRVLAIYFVLVLHSTTLPERISPYSVDLRIILNAIAVTSVPLFVLLSGSLLLSKKEDYTLFYKKRLLRLLLPWLIWTLIYTVIIIWSENKYSFFHVTRVYMTQFQSFWFLPMITGIYLFTPALRIFVRHAKITDIWLVIFLWFLFVSFLPYTKNSLAFPMHVDNGILRQIINYSGYFLLGYGLSKIANQKLKVVSLMSIFLGILWTTVGTYVLSLQNNGVLVRDLFNAISPGVVLLSTGIFAYIFTIRNGIDTVVNISIKNTIIMVSTSSFAIYFVHALIQQLFILFFNKINLLTDIPFDNFINGAVLFTVSFILLQLCFQIPYVKRFIT